MGKINLSLLISFFLIFILGVLLGISIKNFQNREGPINLSPFPKSCQYNGKTYKSGESFPSTDGCNSCGCENGQVACTMMWCE